MKNIDDFCERKGISPNMEEAFVAYIRSDYARKYAVRSDGDTTKLVVGKMSSEEIEDAWIDFTREFKNYLSP